MQNKQAFNISQLWSDLFAANWVSIGFQFTHICQQRITARRPFTALLVSTAPMRSMSTATLATLVLLLLVTAPARVVAGCCDVCLAQTDPAHSEVAYDPLVHNQCSAAKGICCYGCDFAHGSITFQDGVTFDAISGAPVATAGTRIHFTFNSIARVTYDFLRLNQKKTSFVGNQSTSADVEGTNGTFSICVPSAGTIALRGWGSDSCKQVTAETTITVNAAASGTSTTCTAAAGTVKPADTSSSSKGNQAVNSLGTDTTTSKTGRFDVVNCNLNRGSVIKSGDTAVCDCAGDWRNPPACDQYSWTKTVLTIAGAVATLVS